MPRTPKTVLKQSLPRQVHRSGDPWQPSDVIPATVPLPNDVVITKVEGAYTERDRKLWAFLVAAVWDDLEINRIHEIRVAKINGVFQELGSTTTSSWIWESVKRLSKTTVEWELGEDGRRLQGISNMMNAVTSAEARANGVLRFEIPALLCEVIRAPCRFSRIRLHFMIGLSGKYAVTLYMLLESVANRESPVLEVRLDQLRKWLKVPEGKLNEWYDIKRRILEPALKQINDNPNAAGFSVAMDEFKEGRAVDKLRFTLTKTHDRTVTERVMKGYTERNRQADNTVKPPKQPPSIETIILPTSAFENAKKVAPGLDVYFLEAEWREWVVTKQDHLNNPAGSFVGFCRMKYKKLRK